MSAPFAPVVPADDGTADMFAGPGGWDVAAAALGIDPPPVGYELDGDACATRTAAGLVTVRADISAMPAPRSLAGLIGSPPCIVFSNAGKRGGVAVAAILAAGIADQLAGIDTRGLRRRQMAAALRDSGYAAHLPKAARTWKITRTWRRDRATGQLVRGRWTQTVTQPARMDVIWAVVRSAALVLEPARWIASARPQWVALEQVAPVLPLWREYARHLRTMGYSAWCGVLNAADYGVPQTRQRAILIASRVRRVAPPPATHADQRKHAGQGTLFGDTLAPWVSMAAALGWGATAAPVPTVTGGGTAAGGAEPIGHRDRDRLAAEQDAGRWAVRSTYGDPAQHSPEFDPATRPARTVVGAAGSWLIRATRGDSPEFDPAAGPARTVVRRADGWQLHTKGDQRPDGSRQVVDAGRPAPTVSTEIGDQWDFVPPPPPGAEVSLVSATRELSEDRTHPRGLDEPAMTIAFGHSDMRWQVRTSFGQPATGPKADGNGSHGTHEMDPATRPAHAVTGKARDWQVTGVSHLESNQSVDGGPRATRQPGEPSVTITQTSRSARWVLANNNQPNAARRGPDEPAGSLFFGGRLNTVQWVAERPATTVQGDPRVGRPGHKDRDPATFETQFGHESVRITVAEAAVLQSFHPGYPFAGTRTSQFQQAGNAIPPLLALHILGAATGRPV